MNNSGRTAITLGLVTYFFTSLDSVSPVYISVGRFIQHTPRHVGPIAHR
jgi:hypothetical protein